MKQIVIRQSIRPLESLQSVSDQRGNSVDHLAKGSVREDPILTSSDTDDDYSTVTDDPTGTGASREPDVTCDHYHITGGHLLDVGVIVQPGMTIKKVSTAVAAFSRGEKYELQFRHVSPPAFSYYQILWL